MKSTRIIILALLATGALGCIMASSPIAALGICVRVDEPGQGDRGIPSCRGAEMAGNFIKIIRFELPGPNGQWCAKTEILNHGNREENNCEGKPVVGKFILVRRAPPNWHMNGSKLSQGSSVGITGQSKGNLVLKSKAAGIDFTISCTTSHTVGTIDGQGNLLQGQDKGTVKYEGCTITNKENIKPCEVGEKEVGVINTNQLKSHLAYAQVQGTEQIVDIFEPSTSEQTKELIFANIHIINCGILKGVFPVKGSVASQMMPQEEESQEGSLFFPETPISTVSQEGQEAHPKLTLGTNEAIFTGFYGQQIQSGTYGAFSN